MKDVIYSIKCEKCGPLGDQLSWEQVIALAREHAKNHRGELLTTISSSVGTIQ
jgi:hypothetical protein